MYSVDAERRGVVRRKARGKEGAGEAGGEQKGGRAGGDVCPNAVFFPEIAITQMRCWLEAWCVSVCLCTYICASV